MHPGRFIFSFLFILLIPDFYCLKAGDDLPGQQYRITYLTSDNGLSQNTVDCILKDSRGFMWFGTWNGLNRYDGYSFKVYKKEDKPFSLSNNFIHSVCEDTLGNLWIATRNGLNLLNFKADRFTGFFHDPADRGSIAGNWINCVFCDDDGVIWVGINGAGLCRVEYDQVNSKYSFIAYNSSAGSSIRLPGNVVTSIFSDSRHRLWIGTNEGLACYGPKNDKSLSFSTIPGNMSSLSSDEIRCIFEDSRGQIWVGTQMGLNRWVEGTDNFIRYVSSVDNAFSLSHSNVNAIGEDPEGTIFFATLGGLDYYDEVSDRFFHLPVYGQENLSLNNEFINSLWCDNTGLIWVGTDKGGINKFNIYQKQFLSYSAESENTVKLNHNTVNSILEEGKVLWVGTAGGGLNMIDLKNQAARYFTFDSRRLGSLNNDFVTSLCRDSNKSLWIGTWGGGFSKLLSMAGEGSFLSYQNDPGDGKSLVNNFVSTIFEDQEGNLWIGTEGGLDLFNRTDNTFTHVMNQPVSGEPITEVGCLLRDNKGNLWIGTRNGLFFIASADLRSVRSHPDSMNTYCFRSDSGNPDPISENYVISLLQDSKGRLWIGTYGNGLNLLDWDGKDPRNAKFIHYRQEDGLSSNVIYGILEDTYQKLWLSTDYGLSRFDPEKEECSNYFVADGLQSNQFYWSACATGVDGTLYFGGMKGLNFFQPGQIINNQNAPRPVLTDFKVVNNLIEPGKPFGKRIILEKQISETKEIELNYRENTFSFEFSGLNYHLPEKNLYAYKMERVDDDWIVVSSNRRFANYTKLPGGEYTFQLRAANNDGLWSEDPVELKITIKPPFWKTKWFRIFLILIVMGLIGIYLRVHTRSLQLQKRKLEQMVRERTALIEDQKLRLEQQNTEIVEQRDRLIQLNKKVKAVNQLKLKFFTNISHEFRTPLTLILGPLEKLRANAKPEEENRKLIDLISRNAERLLHLINQLMDFRKIEKGKMALHVQEGNPDEFVKAILEAFRDLTVQKGIDLEYVFEGTPLLSWFDHEKLENVLYNLLSNAYKFTHEKGRISVHVRYIDCPKSGMTGVEVMKNSSQSNLQIVVSDTGIGISKEKLPNIFKRFYQADQVSDGTIGSGIGLSLTRDLIKVHRGTIAVESEPGRGTKFTLQIPCERVAFSEDEIAQTRYGTSNLKSHVDILKHLLETERLEEAVSQEPDTDKIPGHPTLLIAEDNFELREFIANRFREDYNILQATNGEKAFELAVLHDPDLIITDIMMPVMDGLQLCRMIKSKIDTSHIPVILLTAKGTVENQIEGLKTGADDYVPKPFNLELLETRVSNLIESRKKLQKIFSNANRVVPEEMTRNLIDQKFLKSALEHIEKNIDNAEFNVNDFASVMCVSRSLLHKKLTALTDQSATDFINTVRLKKSRELMMQGSYNISEVAYAVGYNDPKYFSRLFKKTYGISPSEFVKEIGTKAG